MWTSTLMLRGDGNDDDYEHDHHDGNAGAADEYKCDDNYGNDANDYDHDEDHGGGQDDGDDDWNEAEDIELDCDWLALLFCSIPCVLWRHSKPIGSAIDARLIIQNSQVSSLVVPSGLLKLIEQLELISI